MATIEVKYTFDYYEDKDEVAILQKHKDHYSALNDVANLIRSLFKYSEKESISIEELHDKFYEIINNYDIDLTL